MWILHDRVYHGQTTITMTSVDFLREHVRSSFVDDTFVGTATQGKVLPECITPKSDVTETPVSEEEKLESVLSDPKFGMFSLFRYHIIRGKHNDVLKRRNAVYCSHICSLFMALPLLVFVSQWLMYAAVVSYQVRTYDGGTCPNRASVEDKIMMTGVAIFYFVKSFFLWDNIVDRTHRKKMIPATSYIVMMDTFQEFGFNILVYMTNLWVVFAEQDFLDGFFNMLAMEFLMEMDNEFQRAYFTYLPGVAADIYDNMFVTLRDNSVMVRQKTHDDCRFRCCRRITWLPFKLLMLLFFIFPGICFFAIFYGTVCK